MNTDSIGDCLRCNLYLLLFLNVSDKASVAGLNQETMSDDFLQIDDLVDLVDGKFGDLSENPRELEQPSEVPDESGIV